MENCPRMGSSNILKDFEEDLAVCQYDIGGIFFFTFNRIMIADCKETGML